MAKKPLKLGEALERSGEKIIVPPDVPLTDAVDYLNKEIRAQEKVVQFREEIDGALWDCAYALHRALTEEFGFVFGEPTPGFFGSTPPQSYSVPSGVGKTISVGWGIFTVAGFEATFTTMVRKDNRGKVAFGVQIETRKKNEARARKVAEAARKIVREQSLYRGKAIRVRFFDDDDEPIQMVMPEFMDVTKASEEGLILSREVGEAVSTSIFTPIRYSKACVQAGVPTKRSVLLAGMYGTGKTLTAYVAAKMCEETGRTFVYVEKATELEEAVRFAHNYQPAMIFCEDIDRVTSGGRTIALDQILNILDGIESKNTDLMGILTTNQPASISKAMIRPGRLDDVIEFLPPDTEAVARMIKLYAGTTLDESTDLTRISDVLNGRIPAVIRECIERAKLSQIKLNRGVVPSGGIRITEDALLDAANSMRYQLQLLSEEPTTMPLTEAFGTLFQKLVNGETNVTVNIAAPTKRLKKAYDEEDEDAA